MFLWLLSACPSFRLSACLSGSVCLFFCFSVSLSLCLYLHPYFRLSLYLVVSPSFSPSVYLSLSLTLSFTLSFFFLFLLFSSIPCFRTPPTWCTCARSRRFLTHFIDWSRLTSLNLITSILHLMRFIFTYSIYYLISVRGGAAPMGTNIFNIRISLPHLPLKWR